MAKKKRLHKGKECQPPASPEPMCSSMASPGRETALATFDILETILQFVDMKTLLTSCQRVCTSWRNAIASSARLQQILFFKSTPLNSIIGLRVADKAAELCGARSQCSRSNSDSDDSDATDESDGPSPISDDTLLQRFQNPLLMQSFSGFFSASGWSWSGRCRLCGSLDGSTATNAYALYWGRKALDFLSPGDDAGRRKAFMRKGASWRGMLLARYPITKVIFRTNFDVAWRQWDGVGATQRQDDVMEFPEGLRMGQLFDLFFSMLYLEPMVGFHAARVVWKIPGDGTGRPGCQCDRHKTRREKTATPSTTQSWDLLVNQNYFHIADDDDDVPDDVRYRGGRFTGEGKHRQCQDQGRCLAHVRKRTGDKWFNRSQDFVDGFVAFGTTLEDRARLVERELGKLKLDMEG
ncbi:hypothetical protein JDV02_000633 [Purpureocillium takamizusanense]|uniref:F-box domain-containing protein n=1 Tax=Purpureocillium takamizusanense TaxID=2060973 RepID=A0A9Q8Q768_9HYPO|nr:uncharacterized protein JDV02_000633 [Purpureocillium takamizusanense]UNI13946.1 hypothetical protein JDV02_000633 [Purpureocillium takamizusanense]